MESKYCGCCECCLGNKILFSHGNIFQEPRVADIISHLDN
uniref:Uncharacterized protein n=1 Tax=Nelumbo nucifera TaxID=4432 RepID=A0A822XJX1_NELNU|nr:TPA_asm: hypothetical protein HUJ06_020578 [Nelumbo nucifera]